MDPLDIVKSLFDLIVAIAPGVMAAITGTDTDTAAIARARAAVDAAKERRSPAHRGARRPRSAP